MIGIATCLLLGLTAVVTDPQYSGDSDNLCLKLRLHLVIVTWIVAEETAFFQGLANTVIRGLLLQSGGVERNPGPVSDQHVRDGLAKLICAAPEKVWNVLMVWDIAKPSNVIRNTWTGGRKFSEPDLKATLAWLTNTTESDYKSGWTKPVVADLV